MDMAPRRVRDFGSLPEIKLRVEEDARKAEQWLLIVLDITAGEISSYLDHLSDTRRCWEYPTARTRLWFRLAVLLVMLVPGW